MTLEICQVDFEQKTITGPGFLSTFTRFARARSSQWQLRTASFVTSRRSSLDPHWHFRRLQQILEALPEKLTELIRPPAKPAT